MKKLTLFFGSFLGAIGNIFAQGVLPFVEVPDSLNPFIDQELLYCRIADLDNDGFDDALFYGPIDFIYNCQFKHHFYKGGQNNQFSLLDSLSSPFQSFENFINSEFLCQFSKELDFADYDSDGDFDVILSVFTENNCYNSSKNIFLSPNNGNGIFNTQLDELIELTESDCGAPRANFIDIDLDGDNELHLFYSSSYAGYLYQTSRFYSFESGAQEFQHLWTTEGLVDYIGTSYDLNNDGLKDFIGYQEFRINNGVDTDMDGLFDLTIYDPIFPFEFFPWPQIGNFENDQFLEGLRRLGGYGDFEWIFYSQDCEIAEGEPCDDFSDCTIGETWQNCECIGGEELPDNDGDGICDEIDLTNGDCTLNETCDDGIACTENDSLDENCNCVGEELPDSDGEGICDELDQCPDQNDNIDTNGNDIPDCLEIQNEAEFEEFDDGIIGPNPTPADQKALLDKQVQIFPNPSTGIFTVDSKLKIQHLKVYNAIGEEMPVFISDQNQIDLSLFSNGIYFVELKTEEGILRKKLIKE